MEKTFVMIKPDGVQRKLVGEIISIFERTGLNLLEMKMVQPTRELVQRHYPDARDWYTSVGTKTLNGYALVGKDVKLEFGTDDPLEIGKIVKVWLVNFISSGKVVAMILEGNAAVKNVRRLCGNTLPILADPGSIRGRYCLDSPDAANSENRSIHNVVHASGEVDEAIAEIRLWFPEFEHS